MGSICPSLTPIWQGLMDHILPVLKHIQEAMLVRSTEERAVVLNHKKVAMDAESLNRTLAKKAEQEEIKRWQQSSSIPVSIHRPMCGC